MDMHRLMAKSAMVMTDSGGAQEEAPALGKTGRVLRRETGGPRPWKAGDGRACRHGAGKIELLAANS